MKMYKYYLKMNNNMTIMQANKAGNNGHHRTTISQYTSHRKTKY